MGEHRDRPTGNRRGLSAVALALLLVVAAVAAASAGGVRSFGPERTTYESVVVFQNDDVQPHYRTEALEAVTSVFVEEGVPVTHAVIPTAGGSPITEDSRTCDYLADLGERSGPRVELAVHGYDHRPATDFFGRSEFGGRTAVEQRDTIEEATAIHESCTGTSPNTFVPPFNTYDDETVEALADAGYTTVSGGPEFTRSHFGRAGPFEAGGLVHVPNSNGFVANWTTHEFHSEETLRHAFDAAYANGRVYVQMLHHPTFTTGPDESTVSDRKLDRLRSFLRYVEDHDVKIMTLGEFGDAYASGRLQRTDDGWELVEPGRPFADGLTAAISGWLMATRPRSGHHDRRPGGRAVHPSSRDGRCGAPSARAPIGRREPRRRPGSGTDRPDGRQLPLSGSAGPLPDDDRGTGAPGPSRGSGI